MFEENSILSDCVEKVNHIKAFGPNLIDSKRQHHNKVGHILPWFTDNLNEHLPRISM